MLWRVETARMVMYGTPFMNATKISKTSIEESAVQFSRYQLFEWRPFLIRLLNHLTKSPTSQGKKVMVAT